MDAASPNELFAILLARDLRPEDGTIMVGANMPMARAAAVMAGMTTHPDARLSLGLGIQSIAGASNPPEIHPMLFDPRTLAAEALMFQGRVFDDMSRPDVFFVSGLQVDMRGNINLFGIRDEAGGWKVRGPGSVALATMSTHCSGYYVIMPRHGPRTFVERVDCISALGDAAERRRLGLPGGGVRMVLSDLGVFGFDADGDMTVRSLHAGVTAHAVAEATGFPLSIPEDVATTTPPTDAELELLRTRIDVQGTLR